MTVRITIIMQVSTNGVVFFGTDYPYYGPLSALILPLWDFSIAENGGLVLFRLSDNQTLLNEVGSTINDTLEFDFTPTMLFIVTWDGIPEYGGSQDIV